MDIESLNDYLARCKKDVALEKSISGYFLDKFCLNLDVGFNKYEKRFLAFKEEFETEAKRIRGIKYLRQNVIDEKINELNKKLVCLARKINYNSDNIPIGFDQIEIASRTEKILENVPEYSLKKMTCAGFLSAITHNLGYHYNSSGSYLRIFFEGDNAERGVVMINSGGREDSMHKVINDCYLIRSQPCLESMISSFLELPFYEFVLAHEMGHALSQFLRTRDNKEEREIFLDFSNIYQNEVEGKRRFFRAYSFVSDISYKVRKKSEEAFADSFALSLLAPDMQNRINPDFYSFMRERVLN